jgi:hypothetical protein
MSKMSELFAAVQQAQALMGDEEPPMTRLCIDCKHCLIKVENHIAGVVRLYFCEHPRVVYIDPVDGIKHNKNCRNARDPDGKCGQEAKYWETKYGTA